VTAAASAAASASAAATTATSLANAAKAKSDTAVQPTALDAVKTIATNAATAASTAQTAANNGRLRPTIVEATYGAEAPRVANIKADVLEALRTNRGFVCNNRFGDPAYGSVKQCRITYQLGEGVNKTLVIGEGGYFDPNLIPFSNAA